MNVLDAFNDNQAQSTFSAADIQQHKVAVMIPYLVPFLFFLPVLGDKNSTFCRFHANQQLSWFIFCVIVSLVMGILGFIPFLGTLVRVIGGIAMLLIGILLMLSAGEGKAVRIPVIGTLFEIF